MENTHDRATQTDPRAEDRLEAKANGAPDNRPNDSDPERALEHRAPRLDELAAEVDRYRDQLRDYEKTLVERIADVDDDRRRTATGLQRAWQTQEEALDARLRRWGAFTAASLILFAILVSAALFWMNRQVERDQLLLVKDLSEIKLDRERGGQSGSLDDLVQGKLAELSAVVREISTALDGLKAEQERVVRLAMDKERASRDEADARLGKDLKRLEAEQMTQQAGIKQALAGPEAAKKETERVVQAALDKERTARAEVDARMLGQIQRLETEEQRLVQRLAGVQEAQQLMEAALGGRTGAAAKDQARIAEAIPMSSAAAKAAEGEEANAAEPPANAEVTAGASTAAEAMVTRERLYGLQLIGFRNLEALQRFVGRAGLPAKIYYTEETHKGRPWYALIHGLYNDYAGAETALSELPADLTALAPWIRPFPVGTHLRVLERGPE